MLKVFLKTIAYKILSHFDFGGVVVLMYHSVGDNPEFFTVGTKEFEKQMAHLVGDGFNVLSLNTLKKILAGKLPVPPRAVLITFDDGYEDNFINAYPILKKYNLPAVIFVSTALIGKEISARNGSRLKLVSESQMKEMAEGNLIEFGSHCSNHKKLTGRDDAEIKSELAESFAKLKSILSRGPIAIAYPWGAHDKLVKETAASYYSIGFTVAKGRVFVGNDKLALRRNSIDSEVPLAHFSGIVKYGRI